MLCMQAPINMSFTELLLGAWDDPVEDGGGCQFEWESGLFDFLEEPTVAASAATQPASQQQPVPVRLRVDDVMAELFGSPDKRPRRD